jgi:transposase
VLVDTQGNLLKVRVHPADLHNRPGAEVLLQGLGCSVPADCAPLGFHVLPRRWVTERTLAWTGRGRRMVKDYEHHMQAGEMLTYMAMSRVILRRLAKAAT